MRRAKCARFSSGPALKQLRHRVSTVRHAGPLVKFTLLEKPHHPDSRACTRSPNRRSDFFGRVIECEWNEKLSPVQQRAVRCRQFCLIANAIPVRSDGIHPLQKNGFRLMI